MPVLSVGSHKKLLSDLLLYANTLRYLRVSQIYWRFFRFFIRSRIKVSPKNSLRKVSSCWSAPARRRPSLISKDKFSLLNEVGYLSELKWNGKKKSKLWRYNQHYFDDLNAANCEKRSSWHNQLLIDWVRSNAPTHGVGWEPYPTSLRIVNWIKWQLSGNPLPELCLESLAVQANWLSQNLERHILGNHLFANGKALIYAGLFFTGKEAERWRNKGLKVVACELPEQILADGGHFERSPMYHSIFLEDLLDLVNISYAYPDIIDSRLLADCQECIEKALRWLRVMCHPDNEVSFFNDTALGIAAKPKELFEYANRLGCAYKPDAVVVRKVNNLSESGYVRLQSSHAVALLDVAPLGPDYLPGHGHADTLSFELSLFDQRVFVNCGTSCYNIGVERSRERSTAAHNTVEINGTNSSEVWSSFRVARRAYPLNFSISESAEDAVITCSHNGYFRLPGKPMHTREWRMNKSELIISDFVVNSYSSAIARFHLHPDIELSTSDSTNTWFLQLPSTEIISFKVIKGLVSIEPSKYAPEFGVTLSSQCLAVCLEQNWSKVIISWNDSFHV